MKPLLCTLAAPALSLATVLPAQAPPAASIENLNLVGAETSMPPFSESPIPLDSAFRQRLFGRGLALRGVLQGQYAQNTLAAPVSAHRQTYVGQREFGGLMTNWTLTSDLRQLGLHHAQLYICGVFDWVSWRPAGPKSLQIYGLYFYKSLAAERLQLKAGYVGNNLEVIGLTVGGSTATGAQGVYAVLPFELGLSYFPMTAPSLNLRLAGPGRTYLKTAVQRSLDAAGGPSAVARNHTGLRFAPRGDKLLVLAEAGYQRPATALSRELWLRGGYLHNSTRYPDLATGIARSGNSAAFALADCQLRQPDLLKPGNGLFAGFSAMTADSRFNPYDRYLEARLYQKAPFRARPADQASLVASYIGHSRYLTDKLAAEAKTVWRSSASVTASYSMRVRSGQYLSLGLSSLHGPAITPRAPSALTFAANYTVFF